MSTIAVDNARPSAGGTSYSLTSGVAKAWVNYNQITPTIDDDLNVSSVTDNSTGFYTVNFSTSFSDTNYCGAGSADLEPGGFTAAAVIGVDGTKSTGSVQMATDNVSDQRQDRRNNIQWFGDLA